MNAVDAYKIVKDEFPDREPQVCVRYKKHYIFSIPKEGDYETSQIAVDEKDGSVSYFYPGDDLESWVKALTTDFISIKDIIGGV